LTDQTGDLFGRRDTDNAKDGTSSDRVFLPAAYRAGEWHS